MSLEEKVQAFIADNNLFSKANKLLVAVSGGVDSMVLLSILNKLNYTLLVAHVNFKLRLNESDQDEIFVINTCNSQKIDCLTNQVNTKYYAKKHKLTIQEAARVIRYDWFAKIASENNCDFICTAHHQNDVAETILINLTRGTGIEGLTGIKPKNNNIVRPMLNCSKTEIEQYAANNHIKFITDSSNLSTKYTRNKIRKKVIPVLEQINPSFVANINHFTQVLLAQQYYYQQGINNIKDQIVFTSKNTVLIKNSQLNKQPFKSSLLFELIKNYGFNFTQCNDIINASSQNHTGKIFLSETHKLLINRDELIIEPTTPASQEFIINSIGETISTTDFEIEFRQINITQVNFNQENTFYLNLDLLQFPLLLRPTKTGDVFSPLGLKGSKKISDFFIDKKIDRFSKLKAMALISQHNIVALLPFQISNKFKLHPTVTNVLKITVNKKGI